MIYSTITGGLKEISWQISAWFAAERYTEIASLLIFPIIICKIATYLKTEKFIICNLNIFVKLFLESFQSISVIINSISMFTHANNNDEYLLL